MKLPYLRLLVLSVLILICNYSIGQNSPVDSLSQVLNQDISTTQRVDVLNQLARLLMTDNDSQSLVYITEAIKLSQQEDYDDGLGYAYHNLGEVLIKKGQYDSALGINLTNQKLREDIGHKASLADTYYNIGLINEYQGNLSQALEYYLKTLEIRELLNDKVGISDCYNNIAIVHNFQNNYNKAIEYFGKSLELRKELGDNNAVASSYNNLGIVYRALGQFEKAREYYTNSLKIKEAFEESYGISNTLNNIGITYFYEENYTKALEYYLQSLEIRKEDNNKGYLASSYLNIGEVYVKLSRFAEAERYLTTAKKYALETGGRDDLRLTYQILSELYKKKNNHKKALEFFELYAELNDSLYNEQQNEAITEMQTKYEVEKKEQEIALLQKENEIQAIETENHIFVRNLFILGFVVISFLIVAIFRSYRKDVVKGELLKKHRSEIEQQNEILRELNYEKDQLMKIVAHDMRSPLNQIDGLVQLVNFDASNLNDQQKESLGKITNTTSHSRELLNKILNSKSLDHNQLSLKMESTDIGDLLQSVTDHYRISAKEKNISINLVKPESNVEINLDKDYTEQILENLISNAVKFSPFDKSIKINLSENENKVRIEVEDEGPGVSSADMKKLFGKYQKLSAEPTGGETSTGLGLSIVQKYVKAMDGKVWCESSNGNGAKFIVEFNKA